MKLSSSAALSDTSEMGGVLVAMDEIGRGADGSGTASDGLSDKLSYRAAGDGMGGGVRWCLRDMK